MPQLTVDHFRDWLETYSRASVGNDPQASAGLFALDARYFESPFDEPLLGREAIYQYWCRGAQNLKDKQAAYEIYAVQGNLGIARWRSAFTVIATGQRLELDCLFLVEFDAQGNCSTFREWWHAKPVPPPSTTGAAPIA